MPPHVYLELEKLKSVFTTSKMISLNRHLHTSTSLYLAFSFSQNMCTLLSSLTGYISLLRHISWKKDISMPFPLYFPRDLHST